MTENNKITSLYEQFKNTNKKLKIVCDWDEVIQACEPYALYLAIIKTRTLLIEGGFIKWGFIKEFWKEENVEYSPYGSKLKKENFAKDVTEEQQEIKNSPKFYQQAPFLTIAEDLLKLIKEDKVESLIFLSAYDQKKFLNGDNRKIDIFNETFRNFWIKGLKHEKRLCWLELIPFDSEEKGTNKVEWIKENASDFDLVIDDNPNICKSVFANNYDKVKISKEYPNEYFAVIAPYYPATENQHHKEVLLVKNEVSDLKKEDFS